MQPNIIIVSNRLPVSVKKTDDGLEYYPSVGGLATGLSSYVTDSHNIWIGWPGVPSDDLTESDKVAITTELAKHNCYPVFLSKQQLEDYYNGYSNSVLWPLLHNLPLSDDRSESWWTAYKEVNDLFAHTVAAMAKTNSIIWVHDYQLLLLPAMLRENGAGQQIGFFSHIPFPPSEVFTTLPEARALVEGVLGADLAGFHTPSYTSNFLEVCQALDSGIVTGQQVVSTGHVTRVSDFPMGIDYAKFSRASRSRKIKSELRRLKRKYARKQVILTVDRLDPTKGLVERLRAYRTLLKQNPDLRGRVVMVMLAMPSRTEIAEYKRLKVSVEKLVRDINDTYATKRWLPVDYMFTSLPFETLSALYQLADVAFIAPIRDGMNLVAKEYVASKNGKKGVLILSSTAGAAEELSDALIVDPKKPATSVAALKHALTMPKDELRLRLKNMQKQISDFTVHEWAGSFMSTLRTPATSRSRTHQLTGKHRQLLVQRFASARKRLLLFDYDGVLSAFTRDPSKAAPSAEVYELVSKLTADPANEVVILSGRSKDDLQAWFGDLQIALAAEHGALFRRRRGKNWYKTSHLDNSWKSIILPVLEKYAELTPGAFVEEKEWSLVWHYRRASAYHSSKNTTILKHILRDLLPPYNLVLQSGSKIIEIRPADVNKGRVAQEWLIHEHDFVLAIGDDITDEDTFAVMPQSAYSVHVGKKRTLARYRLRSSRDVTRLLQTLTRS
ncbi:MAG: trehalose-6-phosphate synthase [Candidatus Saccharibacteria bacterium]|nr:trehalose-6-phosphate synthase [Candidatus Saccharibacteria bacterium]